MLYQHVKMKYPASTVTNQTPLFTIQDLTPIIFISGEKVFKNIWKRFENGYSNQRNAVV